MGQEARGGPRRKFGAKSRVEVSKLVNFVECRAGIPRELVDFRVKWTKVGGE